MGNRTSKRSDKYQQQRNKVLRLVSENGLELKYVPNNYRRDRDIVMAAVASVGISLRYASKLHKNDREIVYAAVTSRGTALEFASEACKNDRAIVLAAVTNNVCALEFASTKLRNDRECVLAAVTQNGEALKFASNERKNDRQVVLAAVTSNGKALILASDERKNDREIALAAVQNKAYAFRYVSKELRGDIDFIATALRRAPRYQAGRILNRVPPDMKKKFRSLCSMRHDLGGLLYSLIDDNPSSLDSFLSAEMYRCKFLRDLQLNHLPVEVMKAIIQYEDIEERIREIRFVKELLPIIQACLDGSLDSALQLFLHVGNRTRKHGSEFSFCGWYK